MATRRRFSNEFKQEAVEMTNVAGITLTGIKEVATAPASPWQNAYAERLIGSIRRELLDHVVVLNEGHLRRLLKSYLGYYNEWRTHRSLEGDAPDLRPVRRAGTKEIAEFPTVHGLHHYFLPKAA